MASQNPIPNAGPFDQPDKVRTLGIKVEKRQFWVPRELLAVCSPVFKEMLYGEFVEAKKDLIELPGKKAADFEEFLLCLIPTPTVKEIDYSNVELMLGYAEEYQIDDMRQRSNRALIDIVKQCADNDKRMLKMLRVASYYRLTDALMEIVKQVADNDQRMLKILRIACDFRLIDELKVIVKKCTLGFEIEQLEPMFKELPSEVVAALSLYKNDIPRGGKCSYQGSPCAHLYCKCMYCDGSHCKECPPSTNGACVTGFSWKVEKVVHELLDRLAKD